jgi:hypothetical protein
MVRVSIYRQEQGLEFRRLGLAWLEEDLIDLKFDYLPAKAPVATSVIFTHSGGFGATGWA